MIDAIIKFVCTYRNIVYFICNSAQEWDVLGGVGTEISSGDMNTLIIPGIYRVATGSAWSNIANSPGEGLAAGIIEVKTGSDGNSWRTQYIYMQNKQAWFRNLYINNPSLSSSWQRLDNFGCNTAADLASLLKPYL